jgi:ectoine hydroxylase
MDNYETRKDNEFHVKKRIEPTYWGSIIHDKESAFYADNGYVVLRDVFDSEEMGKAKSACESVFSGETKSYTNMEPDGSQVRSALNIKDVDGMSQLLCNRITDKARTILNSEVYVHQSRINFKAGRSANGWNWHSDFETWHAKDGMPNMRCLTAMICVDENTEENGCLNVIPKSQRLFIGCPKVSGLSAENEFSEQVEGVPNDAMISHVVSSLTSRPVPLVCSAGDVVLFDCNLLHYSGKNSTDDKRTNVYFVLSSIHNKLQRPFSGGERRPEEMAKTIH